MFGRDVESMVRDLVEHAVKLVSTAKKEEVKEKAEQIVEEKILNILIPPIKKAPVNQENGISIPTESDVNDETRQKFKEKLENGDFDHREIEIDVKQSASVGIGMVAPPGLDDSAMSGIQDMISGMMPKKTKKRKVNIKDARKLMLEEESSKLIDMEDVKDKAIQKAENTGIIFIDEIDKVAKSNNKSGGEVSREGVQRDLLPIVEGSTINTKYGMINTDHILFIAAGAFHVAKPSDLIPELQGRFPIRVELENLTKEDFIRILNEPKNALTKQYQALLKAEEVELEYQEDAIEELAEIAFKANEEMENIGARRLHTVMSKLLNETLFDVPDTIGPNAKIVVDKNLVQEKLSGLIKDKDLSEYIL